MAAIGNGLLRVVSSDQLTRDEQAAASRRAAEEANNKPMIQDLAAHVTKCWEAAKTAKSPITDRLLAAQRARMGMYSPEMKAEIASFGGSEEYARISANKSRIAEAWLKDIYLGQTEKPWTVTHTPSPDLTPEVVSAIRQAVGAQVAQYFASTGNMPAAQDVREMTVQLRDAEIQRMDYDAKKTAERMERKMEDQLVEGGFHSEFSKFLSDITTYPAAHFKGTVLRKNKRLKWAQQGGTWAPAVQEEVVPQFERICPFRAFPAPGITDPQQGYFIEWLEFSREDVYNLIGVPGFNEAAIRAVLDEYGSGGLTDWLGLTQKAEIQNMETTIPSNSPAVFIDCLEFKGPVRGKDLIDWGMDASQIDDADKDYEANVWLIGRWVIKAQLNPNPLGRRNVYKASYEEVPGSYWGLGLIDALADVQGIVNAAVRSLVNNMGLASGPQIGVNVDRLPPGEDLTNIHPWKIWQFNESQVGNSEKPIEFFQPSSNVGELLTVIKEFYQLADDFSLVPRYMGGNTDIAGGVGRTASGMSMLMNAANKGMKGVVAGVDINVMTPMLEDLYNFNMLYSDDPSIKGDSQVVARGAISLMQLESLQLRRNEFLQATANPIDSQIVGVPGRATILREVAKGLEMDVNEIVPPKQALAGQAMPQMQGGQQAPAPNREQLQTGQATTDNFSQT